jgi:hypothetical protein
MQAIDGVVGRFPEHELAIRRRCANDATFRSICADHVEATRALAYWRSARPFSNATISQYGTLVRELEGEIARLLREAETSAFKLAAGRAPGLPNISCAFKRERIEDR